MLHLPYPLATLMQTDAREEALLNKNDDTICTYTTSYTPFPLTA